MLRVESGADAGKSVRLLPGVKVCVGRTGRADFVLAGDPFLSSVHMELLSDGHRCALRDLDSSNGTVFGGKRVKQATLVAGDRFTAGQTQFVLVEEASTAESIESVGAPEPLASQAKERLLKELRTNLQPLYAIVDAACDSRVLSVLTQHRCAHASLYASEEVPELMRFAPYLVALPAASSALEPLLTFGWAKHWSVFLTSAASGSELRAFLQKLLVTVQPDGQRALLRFYDPRVLRTLLENAEPRQWPRFFGPVRAYLIASAVPQQATGFAVNERGLERYDIPLEGDKPPKVILMGSQRDLRPADRGGAVPSGSEFLVLSEQQAAEMKVRERDLFADELFAAMQKEYPTRFSSLGEATMREWVRYGCSRSARYGIQTQPGMRAYVALMMLLGRRFDEDPELPWASDLLGRRLPPTEKMSRLQRVAQEYLQQKT